MADLDLKTLGRRMDGAVEAFHRELAGLRTGRASASLLEPLMVDAYGSQMPMNQVGSIGVPEPRMLSVQVWDKGLVSAVEKAIRESNLGLNPMVEGQMVRVPVPDLTEERRRELARVASKYAEQARIAARNVRRDAMDQLKKMEKDSEISKDEHRDLGDEVQKLTDKAVGEIDKLLADKEREIMTV
ncbi:MAG: ribosome recycling factor [Marinovum algicola]|uniref:ribosome recycling factor n=1 Tax=Marinovum algicola TaxID=42444 RepID=UPI0032EE1150